MSIKPEYFTLFQLLNNRLFRIPTYQRAYSWERKQRQELFSDIDKVHKCGDSDRHHFMATIVCLNTNEKEEVGTDEFTYLDVVDGQQRLTTLIVLLKALSKELSRGDESEAKEAGELSKLLVKDDEQLILLQTNHDSSNIFRDYLVDGKIPRKDDVTTLAEKNLVSAFQDCESFVRNWKKRTSLLQLLKILKNRLDFIFYVLEDEGAVYTVFEVLNSRGLPVDWLDKCKSILMGIVYEQAGRGAKDFAVEIHQHWTQIYNTIGLRNLSGDEIVKFTATLWNDEEKRRVLSAEDAVESFRTQCSSNYSQVVKVSRRLLTVTKKLKELYDDKRIEAVTEVSHARLVAVAIKVADQLSEEERHRALDQWERVTFRIFGLCDRDARNCVGEYTSLAHRILSKRLSAHKIISELQKIGRHYPIDYAISELQNREDYYSGWGHELRYFLYRYEEHLAHKANSRISDEVWTKIWDQTPDHSIEHVLPQEYEHNAAWSTITGADEYVHQLGNLGILAPDDNSRAGNKGFATKVPIYNNSNLRLMKEIATCPQWTVTEIEDRGKRLIAWAKQQWNDI